MAQSTRPLRMNEQIRISPVRVIDEDNNMLGVMPVDEALRRARDLGVDLVEVSPQERPPVCRIMDYGRHKYLQKKKLKTSRQAHQTQLKQLRMRPGTDIHDIEIKAKHALEFLEEGHKVQFNLRFRGRERAHKEEAFEAFQKVIAILGETAKVERPPMMEGKNMIMIVMPAKMAKPKPSKPKQDGPKSPAPIDKNKAVPQPLEPETSAFDDDDDDDDDIDDGDDT